MIKNFLGHLKTITAHRHMVMIHCFKAGIIKNGLLHDLSKYSPTEFIPGVIYFQGNRSPNEREREVNGYSMAWIHHKGRNKHHFEYWTDYSTKTGTLDPVKMPDKYIFEMFCDRVAASKIYKKDEYNDRCPLEYFLKAKKKREIETVTAKKLEFLLTMLAEKGEDYTFRFIRKQVKKIRKSEKKR
ncbi:MAG: catalase [Ruminococcus sp.]|nr:catalase [Ruminococcus sp.]MDE7099319.1 catalase [Ruminococcus sp.]